jgi:preprotein translocase subunit YajC
MASGIHGRVTGLGDKVVTVEIAPRVQVQVDRSAIQNVEKSPGGEAREKEREKS